MSAKAEEECRPGSLAEFLVDRNIAFNRYGKRRKFFRVWHTPWMQRTVRAEVLDDGLLQAAFPWWKHCEFVTANHSCGVFGVRMGMPRTVADRLPGRG
jgi:hypothetical protein